MGRQGSIFAFFALSTVAIIVMHPGPRDSGSVPGQSASVATRNSMAEFQPSPQAAPLPVPDDVLSQIKRANQATVNAPVSVPVRSASVTPQAPALPQAPVAPVMMQDTQVAPVLPPSPQPSFNSHQAPVAANPARSELRDMSWASLGALQQLGHGAKAPGGEGSLISSIVRRSLAHVDDPVKPAAPTVPAVRAAPQPRQSSAKLAAPHVTPGPIGQRGTYTVTSGDNLALIAIKLYGSALKTDQILMDNPTLRANPNALRIGQVISYRKQ